MLGGLVNFFANTAMQFIMAVSMTGALVILALAVPCGAIYWHRQRIKEGRRGVEAPHIIAICLAGAAILLLVAASAYTWQQFFSSTASQTANFRNAESKIEYVRNGIISGYELDGPDGPQLVVYVADSITMGDRLRVFVDYSIRFNGAMGWSPWPSKNRIEIDAFKDYVRGQKLVVHVLSRYEDGSDKSLIRWGAPSSELPDNSHKFTLSNTYRARLVFMGPDGKEQRIYFMIVPAQKTNGTVAPYVFSEEHMRFREQWEREDAAN